MEKLNDFMFFAENNNDFELFMQKNLDDYIDVMSYLRFLDTDESQKLFQLISSKLEFLDEKNILLNFSEIKSKLGLKSKFVLDLSETDKSELGSVEIDEKAASLSREQANKMCSALHGELLRAITALYGEIKQ